MTPRDPEATKRRIFDAATTEFASRGVAGARIDRIAAAASANKQLIYAYFGNKQDLFDAVVTEQVARFQQGYPRSLQGLAPLRVPLVEFGESLIHGLGAAVEIAFLGRFGDPF